MSKVRTVPSSELYRCRTCRESAGFFARKLHSRAGRQCEGCKKRVKGREEEGGKKGSPDGGAGASRLRPAMPAAAGIKFFERMPRVASRRIASRRRRRRASECRPLLFLEKSTPNLDVVTASSRSITPHRKMDENVPRAWPVEIYKAVLREIDVEISRSLATRRSHKNMLRDSGLTLKDLRNDNRCLSHRRVSSRVTVC